MQIRRNLYMVSGGVYGQLGNVFAVRYQGGCFLIDDGNPEAYDTIVGNLRDWGISENEITHVFLTHGHDDHAGTSKKFQELGAKIVVGRQDAYMLEQGNFGKESPFINHQMPCCEPDCLIDGDTHITLGDVEIDIYAMPGHTDGTLLYYVESGDDRILFSGDMFSCDGEKGDMAHIWWKGDMNYNAERLGESFRKLWELDLKPTLVAGGHGNPRIGRNAKDMIMIAYKDYLLNAR